MPIGSKFDDFLKEEGIFEITTAAAIKSVLRLGSTSEALIRVRPQLPYIYPKCYRSQY